MDNALQLLKKFCQYDYLERDAEKALSLLSDDICWFGTSNHEDVHNIKEARTYIIQEIKALPSPYKYKILYEKDLIINENSGVAFLRIELENQGVKVANRITVASRRVNGTEKLCAMHFSVEDVSQHADEFFPLRSAKEKIAREKQDLIISTMTGGLIGVYLKPGYPLYSINSRMLEYLGYESEEEYSAAIKGLIINSIFPEDRDYVVKEVARQLSITDQYAVDYRLKKQDGSYIWVHDIGRKTLAENSAEVLISVCYDITKDHNKQIQLDNLINALPGGVALYRYVNDDLETIYQSKGVGALTGRSKNEYSQLVHHSAWDSIHKEDLKRVKAAFKKVATSNAVVSLDYRVPHINGGMVWINGCFRRTDIEDNIPIIHAVFSEMPKLRELVSDMVENSGVAMIVTDAATKELLYVNKEGLKIRTAGSPKNYDGQLCYKYLLGHDKPCPNCRCLGSNPFHSQSREVYIAGINKYFVTQGRLANWAGRKAHIEYLLDVTENHLMMQKLTASEKALDAAAEAAGLWHWKYNPTTAMAYYSKKIQEDFGMPAVAGRFPEFWFEQGFMLKEYKEVYYDAVQKIKAGVPKTVFEAKIRFKDGTIHWGEFRFTNLPKIDGEDSLVVCTARLIDFEKSLAAKYELEKQKPSLGESTLLLHAIFNLESNKTEEYVYTPLKRSLAGDFPTMKQTLANFAGQIVDSTAKKELLAFNDIAYLREQFAKGNTVFSADYRRRLSDGQIIWVRNIFHLILEPNTQELLLFEYCYNINSNKMLEEILRLTGQKDYQRISCIDFKRGVITQYSNYNNISTTDAIDYDLSRTTYVRNNVPPDMQAAFLKAGAAQTVIGQVAKNGQYEFTSPINKEDGTLGMVRIRFIPYDEENQIYIATRADVTDLLRTEETKNRRLEETLAIAQDANNAKTDFLSSMSHDIRTPLNAIIGMCELGIADIKDSKRVLESLTSIQSSSLLLLALINNILDMSRIESGKLLFKSQKFSLTREINRAETTFRALAEQKGLRFHVYVDMIHDTCCGDISKIHSALDNILSNAIKYTPKGGTVTYDITEEPSNNSNVGHYRFEITDTGVGMDEETQAHIFEPFYRSTDSLKAKLEGTGLGLSISKAIIDFKGGLISVKSTKGKGTTFVVTLPLPLENDEEALPAPETAIATMDLDRYDLTQAHVLLCEDHLINQKLAVRLLERAGATVTVADNGQSGVETFLHAPVNTFNIVLMDIRMPKMDGYHATLAIRSSAHPQAKTIPILAMTANAFADDIQKSLNAGMNDHLAKPIMPNVLYQRILHFIGVSRKRKN